MRKLPILFSVEWKVTWGGQTRDLEAELVITESGGSWKTFATTRNDPCVGREVPIAIESSTADTATITLKFSEVINGCPDSMVRLKLIDANKASGTRGKAELTLTKK